MKIKSITTKKPARLHHPNHWNAWENEYKESHFLRSRKWTFGGLALLGATLLILLAAVLY